MGMRQKATGSAKWKKFKRMKGHDVHEVGLYVGNAGLLDLCW